LRCGRIGGNEFPDQRGDRSPGSQEGEQACAKREARRQSFRADIFPASWYVPAPCVRSASGTHGGKGMTQKHVPITAYAVLLILGVSTAWAEAKKESRRELLPAPKSCCEKPDCPDCCCKTEACASCCNSKESAIERRLRALCSIDFRETPLCEAIDRFRE